MATSSLVTEENLTQINDALAQLDHAQKEVELAMRAGLHDLPGGESIAQAEDQIKQQRSILLRIKNTYFPNQ